MSYLVFDVEKQEPAIAFWTDFCSGDFESSGKNKKLSI